MNKINIDVVVTTVVQRYTELSTQCDALNAILKMDYESPLMRSIWMMFECYAASASALIGDNHEWLSWYIWDNQCGKKELCASLGTKKLRPVRTVKDLVKLIKASIAYDASGLDSTPISTRERDFSSARRVRSGKFKF